MTFLVVANVVWPALFLSIRMAAWWCVVISIFIEGLALWRFAQVPLPKALTASVVVNIASVLIGVLLLPLLGLRLEALADVTYKAWLDWGTFNPITYATTWLGATLLTTVIECFTLWLAFRMPFRRKWMAVVLLANAATVAIAGFSLFLFSAD